MKQQQWKTVSFANS